MSHYCVSRNLFPNQGPRSKILQVPGLSCQIQVVEIFARDGGQISILQLLIAQRPAISPVVTSTASNMVQPPRSHGLITPSIRTVWFFYSFVLKQTSICRVHCKT